VNKNWRCPAIEKSVVIYDNDIIRPCCVINWKYSKPVADIVYNDRFLDLYKDNTVPAACKKCTDLEESNITSLRLNFLELEKEKISTTSIQFLDIRNSNFCNAKCRFCGPHHSNLWDFEKNGINVIRHTSIKPYMDLLINENIIEIYFAGGEPMISEDHYLILTNLVDKGFCKTINLRYSSNLSTLKYKDKDIFKLWNQFKSVHIMVSADGIGEVYENIRSGLSWDTVEKNINILDTNDIKFNILYILNNLNIWFLKESLEYYKKQGWNYNIDVINGPSDYMLGEIPENLKGTALDLIESCYNLLPKELYNYIKNEIVIPSTGGFNLNINDQRMYDAKRNESLIKLLTDAKIINE
jgi:hypothetical protein